MTFSHQELRCIGEAQKSARLWRRRVLTASDIAGALVSDLARSGTDRIIPYCLAIFPDEVRPAIERLCRGPRWSRPTSGSTPRRIIGRGPPAEVWAAIRIRYRPVVVGIRAAYRERDERPDLRPDRGVPEVDLFWVSLKAMESVAGETCF